MDAVRAVSAILGSTAMEAITALRSSLRALIDWTVGIASRQANLVVILSQSLTLFFLALAIAYLRKLETRSQSSRLPGLERS